MKIRVEGFIFSNLFLIFKMCGLGGYFTCIKMSKVKNHERRFHRSRHEIGMAKGSKFTISDIFGQ